MKIKQNNLLCVDISELKKKEVVLFIVATAAMAAWFSVSITNGYFSGECVEARSAIQAFLS